jgi:hypothetical protein
MAGILGAFPFGYVVWFGSDAVLPQLWRVWVRGALGVNLDGVIPAFGDLTRFPFWMGFAIIFGLGWLAILLATLLTRPESMGVLRRFYRDVRPIGFWGPVEAELPAEERKRIKQRARAEAAACGWGVAFYFLMVLALFAAMGGRFVPAIAAALLTVIAGALFARSLLGSGLKVR